MLLLVDSKRKLQRTDECCPQGSGSLVAAAPTGQPSFQWGEPGFLLWVQLPSHSCPTQTKLSSCRRLGVRSVQTSCALETEAVRVEPGSSRGRQRSGECCHSPAAQCSEPQSIRGQLSGKNRERHVPFHTRGLEYSSHNLNQMKAGSPCINLQLAKRTHRRGQGADITLVQGPPGAEGGD